MSLLPSNATYAEEVADYFLAFRGSGLTLSPLDAELVLTWHDAGIPYEVVCRGIRRAVESASRDKRPGEPAVRSLRACRKAVAEEFRRFSGLATGKARVAAPVAPESAGKSRLSRARAALKKARRESDGEGSKAAARRRAIDAALMLAAAEAVDPAEASRRIRRLEDALALCYLRALPFGERVRAVRESREALGSAGTVGMSPRARRASLRAHRVVLARAHGDLPTLK